jgi:cytochrome P450
VATIPAASQRRETPDWFRFEVVDDTTYYEGLAAKRRETPIEITSPLPSLTESVVTAYRYADVARIISDESEFSSDVIAARYRPVLGRRTMVALNWHERRPIRSVLGSVLGRRNVNRLVADVIVPVIEPIAQRLGERAEVDLVAEVSSVVPSMVIARLMGLPPDAAPVLLHNALAMMSYIDSPKSAIRGSRALRKLFTRLIEERRSGLGDGQGDDLVSLLLAADGEADPLSDEDVVDLLILLAFAGTETAFPGIGSMFGALLQHPDQMEMVRSTPALAGNAVDEALRWEAPVQATFRAATRDTRLGDIPVPVGTTVLAHLGSANHDIPGLVRPDRFDVERPGPIQHLSFGLGARRCIGMHLARLEMRLALEHVLAACPRLRPVSRDDVRITGQFVRGPVRLVVETS